MATYLDGVEHVLVFYEKLPIANATAAQKILALRAVNDGVRYTYNNGDLSFKTVLKPDFSFAVPLATAATRGVPLPADFMGFHQTGQIYNKATPQTPPLIYRPFHWMMARLYGFDSVRVQPPTHYSLGGPMDPDSALNQRELFLWPTPPSSPWLLNLIYQRVAPDDVMDLTAAATTEIPRIPATWHESVIFKMATYFRAADKGQDSTEAEKVFATAVKQMNVQEPHGREAAPRRQINPAWRY